MKQHSIWDELVPTTQPVDNFPRLSEVASPDRCHRCDSMIWKVIERGGFTVRLDPEPLDAMADVVAYLARRSTFRVWPVGGGRFEVDYRTTHLLKSGNAADINLAEHICDPNNIRTELPDYWPSAIYTTTEEPPF